MGWFESVFGVASGGVGLSKVRGLGIRRLRACARDVLDCSGVSNSTGKTTRSSATGRE